MSRPTHLPALAVAGFLVLAVLALYRDTLMQMSQVWWRSDTFAHGMLVGPVVVFLLWRDRARLAATPLRPAVGAHALVALAALGWMLGVLAEAPVVSQFSLVAVLVSAVLAVFGWQAARVMGFALGFLFFAVPAGEFLLPALMEATADFTVWAVGASGVPVYREGLRFTLPSGQWSVVEACSGLRYLIASTVAGSLFAYLNFSRNSVRAAFIVASMIVPIVANWLRAYLIVMLGHLSDNRLAAGADHLIYGWFFFALVMAGLFAIGSRFRDASDARPVGAALPPPNVALVTHALVAASIAGVAPLAASVLSSPLAATPPALNLPQRVDGWHTAQPPGDWQPRWVGTAQQLSRAWAREGQAVGVMIAHYPARVGGARATSSENVLVKTGDARWQRVSAQSRRSALGAMEETLIESRAERLRVWSAIWVAGAPGLMQMNTGAAQAALGIAVARLSGHAGDAALIAFYTADDEGAHARLALFAQEVGPTLLAALGEASR